MVKQIDLRWKQNVTKRYNKKGNFLIISNPNPSDRVFVFFGQICDAETRASTPDLVLRSHLPRDAIRSTNHSKSVT